MKIGNANIKDILSDVLFSVFDILLWKDLGLVNGAGFVYTCFGKEKKLRLLLWMLITKIRNIIIRPSFPFVSPFFYRLDCGFEPGGDDRSEVLDREDQYGRPEAALHASEQPYVFY